MLSFKYLNYLKFYIGDQDIRCHIDAVHAKPPRSDLYTEEIVFNTIKETRCSGIISMVSRVDADLNRNRNIKNIEAVDEYREVLKKFLSNKKIIGKNGFINEPYLHLTVHGMTDRPGFDVEIGTFKGASCSRGFRTWFINSFKKYLDSYIPGVNMKHDYLLWGYPSLVQHRLGDPFSNYPGYGNNFNTVQLEFSKRLREERRNEIIKILRDIIFEFNESRYNNTFISC